MLTKPTPCVLRRAASSPRYLSSASTSSTSTSKAAFTSLLVRHASTTSSSASPQATAAAAATTTTSAKATGSPSLQPLDWDAFLRLRKLKRRYNLASSIVTAGITTAVGFGYLANKEIDVTQTILGMDPLVVFGLATIGCGAAGWLVGPAIGSTAFGLAKRRYMAQFLEREREFLEHIKRNRVDPSFQSVYNPVPDYYGEKIGSVRQYRQWLKDQRAYNRKREKFL